MYIYIYMQYIYIYIYIYKNTKINHLTISKIRSPGGFAYGYGQNFWPNYLGHVSHWICICLPHHHFFFKIGG